MKRFVWGAAGLLLLLVLSPGSIAQTPPEQTSHPEETTTAPPATTTEAPAAAAQGETMKCSDCHDQAAAFVTNPHARGALQNGQVPNSVCETCHGNGQAHMEGGGDKSLIVKPTGREGADNVCLMCHEKSTDRISRHAGMHANSATVNCLTCHSIHSPDIHSAHLVAKPQLNLCGECHSPQVSSFRNKPYAHRIGRGGMECSSCHEPHGRPSRESLRRSEAGELPCLSCHSDKRGPFVFQHGALSTGDCMNCHEPHGSSNPKRLKRANVWQLCIECHSPITSDTLGSQPPSFHNLNTPRYQNCTTCHTAIHGSNTSPQLFK